MNSHDRSEPDCGTTVVVLSAGGSPYLGEVLQSVVAQGESERLLIWSGRSDRLPPAPGFRVVAIPPEEFHHGGTRNLAVSLARGRIIAFLSDDATALDGWLQAVRSAFQDESLGALYGRHVPRPDAPLGDRLYRTYAYGNRTQASDSSESIGRLPVSNANSAYRVVALKDIGGFPRARFAEDRAAAESLVRRGWVVRYEPKAAALHSHVVSLGELFHRGIQLGRSGAQLRANQGSVLRLFRHGWAEGGPLGLIVLARDAATRLLGYHLGRVAGRSATREL